MNTTFVTLGTPDLCNLGHQNLPKYCNHYDVDRYYGLSDYFIFNNNFLVDKKYNILKQINNKER